MLVITMVVSVDLLIVGLGAILVVHSSELADCWRQALTASAEGCAGSLWFLEGRHSPA